MGNDDTAAASRTDADCQGAVGKAGACVFKERDTLAKRTDDDLAHCQDVGHKSDCQGAWGACYSEDSGLFYCITKDNEAIGGCRAGDCKTTPVEVNSTVVFDDVCIFTAVEQTLFKCPSVPSFKKDDAAASCNQEGVSYACFSLREGVTWQCLTGDASVPNCIATQMPLNEQAEKGETYDGVCVHEGSSSWESAEDGDKLSIRTTSTTTTSTTTESTTTTGTTTESTTVESTTTVPSSTTAEPSNQTTSKP